MIRLLSRRDFVRTASAAALLPTLLRRAAAADAQTAALCKKLQADPLRPQFHLLPAKNWMNDPNGPIFFKGKYHMFHQYNPNASVWGDMHWAHAVSPDMVHWTHEPVAIAPTPNGYDGDGVFSGSAVLDHGTPTVIYTGVAPAPSEKEATLRDGMHTWREVQCLATSHDPDLRTWQKLAEPVIATPPAGLEVTGFRDPCLWREGGAWMLALGSGFRGKGGAVLLYTSKDLRQWTYLHPLTEGAASGTQVTNPVDTGDMWECPDFFPLGDKHVLLVSTAAKERWKVGTYKDQRFTPEKEGMVDYGAYYAAKSMIDKEGNRVLWGWIPETRPQAEHAAAGWAGVIALPRVLSLGANDELQFNVLPALEKLRGPQFDAERASAAHALEGFRIRDLAAELQIECRPPAMLALTSESGANFETIRVVKNAGGLELQVNDLKAPMPGDAVQPVKIRAILDGSVLEVFANRSTAITARIYQVPTSPLKLAWEGERTKLQAWQIQPISNNRLTSPLCE